MKKYYLVFAVTFMMAGCGSDSTSSPKELAGDASVTSIANGRSLLVSPTKLVLDPKKCHVGDFGELSDGNDDGFLKVTALYDGQCQFEFKYGGCGGDSTTYRCLIPAEGPAVTVEVINGMLTPSFQLNGSDIVARDGPNAR